MIAVVTIYKLKPTKEQKQRKNPNCCKTSKFCNLARL